MWQKCKEISFFIIHDFKRLRIHTTADSSEVCYIFAVNKIKEKIPLLCEDKPIDLYCTQRQP